jgi:hypothetical protein
MIGRVGHHGVNAHALGAQRGQHREAIAFL